MSGTHGPHDGVQDDEHERDRGTYRRRRFLQLSGVAAGGIGLAAGGAGSAAAAGNTWDVRDAMANNGWDADRAVDEIVRWADPGDTVLFRDGQYEIGTSHWIGIPLTLKGTAGAELVRTSSGTGFRFVGDGLVGGVAGTTADVGRGDTRIELDTGAVDLSPGDHVQIREGDYYDAGSDGGTNEYAVELAEVADVGAGWIELASGTNFSYDASGTQVQRAELLDGPVVEGLTMVGDNNDPDRDYMAAGEYTRGMFEMQWVRGGVFRDCTIENYFSVGYYFFDCLDTTWDGVVARSAQSKGRGKGEPLKAEQCTGVQALSPTVVDCRRGVDIGQGTSDVLVKNPQVSDCSLVGVGQHPNTDDFRAGSVRIEGGEIETVGTGVSHADGDTAVVGTRIVTGSGGLAIEGPHFDASDVTIIGKSEGGSGNAVKVTDNASDVSVQGVVEDRGNAFRNAAVIISPRADVSGLDFDLDITTDSRFYAFDMRGVRIADVTIDGDLNSNPDNTDIAIHSTYEDRGVLESIDIGADLWNHGGSGICLLRGDSARRVRVHDATLEVGGDYGVWIGYDLSVQRKTLVENCTVRGAETQSLAFDGSGSAYVAGNSLNAGMRAASGLDVNQGSYDYGGSGSSGSSVGGFDSSDSSDGSDSSGGSGGDEAISVVGTGNVTEYEFVVSDALAAGDNVESEDAVSGERATGTVQWRSDNYSFSGDVEAFTVHSGDANVDVWVSGTKYAPSDFPEVGSSSDSGSSDSGGSGGDGTYGREMSIVGTGDPADYEFAVSGDLRAADNTDSEDAVSGSSASGSVQWQSDNYSFSGEFTDFTASAPVEVWIDGQKYGAADLGKEWHTFTVVGEGDLVNYEFAVSGDVKPTGTLEDNDDVRDGGGAGAVLGGGDDRYAFTGDLTDFSVTYGDAADVRVLVDGSPVSVGDAGSSGGTDGSGGSDGGSGTYDRDMSIVGTGEETAYEFTVGGDLRATDNVETGEGEDAVDGSTATGSVKWRSDNYEFSGDVESFTVHSGDESLEVWIDGTKCTPSDFGGTSTTDSGSHDGSGSDGGGSYDKDMAIVGTGDPVDYEFAVSGDLRAADNTDSEDAVSGSSASGTVNWYSDNYEFSGDVTAFTASVPVEVWIDGTKYAPSDLG
jgi:hypothetical protein